MLNVKAMYLPLLFYMIKLKNNIEIIMITFEEFKLLGCLIKDNKKAPGTCFLSWEVVLGGKNFCYQKLINKTGMYAIFNQLEMQAYTEITKSIEHNENGKGENLLEGNNNG
jgi:hypothetical protein